MDSLSDEIILIIFCNTDDPASLSLVSKRLYAISKDPWTRATYFIERHGKLQALYFALGRGKLLTDQVLDIMLTSGCSFSRYLVQCVVGHYTKHTPLRFVRAEWCRSLSFQVFSHLLSLAAAKYGNETRIAKGEDDGYIFHRWLVYKKNPQSSPEDQRRKREKEEWERISGIFEKFGFMPFAPKDPIMVDLPLAMSLEPRLLPLAVANGFEMSEKYRDFVYRKLFEKPPEGREGRQHEIVKNVRDLSRLDPKMFLSRTVAAEVCMEARSNPKAYEALKQLDKGGDLLFSLETLVCDLLKLFLRSRAIINESATLQTLYSDFPCSSIICPQARLVVLISIFTSKNFTNAFSPESGAGHLTFPLHRLPSSQSSTSSSFSSSSSDSSLSSSSSVSSSSMSSIEEKYNDDQKKAVKMIHQKLEKLSLTKIERDDLVELLKSPFVETEAVIWMYAKKKLQFTEVDLAEIATEAIKGSLRVSCKGKLFRSLTRRYPALRPLIASLIAPFKLDLENIPSADDLKGLEEFRTNFALPFDDPVQYCPDHIVEGLDEAEGHSGKQRESRSSGTVTAVVTGQSASALIEQSAKSIEVNGFDLGPISQETLSARIREEENGSRSSRRRYSYWNMAFSRLAGTCEAMGRSPWPYESHQVGSWVLEAYGPRNPTTAIVFTHALINRNDALVWEMIDRHVPITFGHMRILAKLGIDPGYQFWSALEKQEYYADEEEYLRLEPSSSIKSEQSYSDHDTEHSDISAIYSIMARHRGRSLEPPPRKRLRHAERERSHVSETSDDDMLIDFDHDAGKPGPSRIDRSRDLSRRPRPSHGKEKGKGKGVERPTRIDFHLGTWVNQLTVLLKEEDKQLRAKKKAEKDAQPSCSRSRIQKTEFHKLLALNLKLLRSAEDTQRAMHQKRGYSFSFEGERCVGRLGSGSRIDRRSRARHSAGTGGVFGVGVGSRRASRRTKFGDMSVSSDDGSDDEYVEPVGRGGRKNLQAGKGTWKLRSGTVSGGMDIDDPGLSIGGHDGPSTSMMMETSTRSSGMKRKSY